MFLPLASFLSPDIRAAYAALCEIVADFLDKSNYFTIELRDKMTDYEYKKTNNVRKVSWKEYFADSYA